MSHHSELPSPLGHRCHASFRLSSSTTTRDGGAGQAVGLDLLAAGPDWSNQLAAELVFTMSRLSPRSLPLHVAWGTRLFLDSGLTTSSSLFSPASYKLQLLCLQRPLLRPTSTAVTKTRSKTPSPNSTAGLGKGTRGWDHIRRGTRGRWMSSPVAAEGRCSEWRKKRVDI